MKTYLYIITNNLSHKFYVGISKDYQSRWKSHLQLSRNLNKKSLYISRAIAMHGAENFSFNIIEEFEKRSECSKAEVELISMFRLLNIGIYNMHAGGNGSEHSEFTKAKIAAGNIGKVVSQETKLKATISREKFYQTIEGEEVRKNISKKVKQNWIDGVHARTKENKIIKLLGKEKLISEYEKYKSVMRLEEIYGICHQTIFTAFEKIGYNVKNKPTNDEVIKLCLRYRNFDKVKTLLNLSVPTISKIFKTSGLKIVKSALLDIVSIGEFKEILEEERFISKIVKKYGWKYTSIQALIESLGLGTTRYQATIISFNISKKQLLKDFDMLVSVNKVAIKYRVGVGEVKKMAQKYSIPWKTQERLYGSITEEILKLAILEYKNCYAISNFLKVDRGAIKRKMIEFGLSFDQ